MTNWITLICVGSIIVIGLIYACYYFFYKNVPFQGSDLDDITGWRPSRDFQGAYWRYNHSNGQYQYCEHNNMDTVYEDSKEKVLRCPVCGHIESNPK